MSSSPSRRQFLRRATGGWEGGILYDRFRDANDVGLAVVRALRNLEERGARAELEPAAIARAQELATSARREGYGHGGASARSSSSRFWASVSSTPSPSTTRRSRDQLAGVRPRRAPRLAEPGHRRARHRRGDHPDGRRTPLGRPDDLDRRERRDRRRGIGRRRRPELRRDAGRARASRAGDPGARSPSPRASGNESTRTARSRRLR